MNDLGLMEDTSVMETLAKSVSSVSVLTEDSTSIETSFPPIVNLRDSDQKSFDSKQIYQQTVMILKLNINWFCMIPIDTEFTPKFADYCYLVFNYYGTHSVYFHV